jgi:hypothetical protein
MRSGVSSVDTNPGPYTEYKQSIKEERLFMPEHPVLQKETKKLIRDAKKDKVDHPPKCSKDVSDAVAGSIYILQMREATYTSGQKRERTRRTTTGSNYNRRTGRKLRIRGGTV